MQELTKVFNGTILPIDMINDREFMVDISGIAKANGKNIGDWRDSKRMQKIFKLKEKSFNLKQAELLHQVGHSTIIHSSLLVNFARFISVEFEDWCDNTIMDILTGNYRKEINQLKAEKKLAMLRDDGTTSVRGISQRTRFSEKQIRTFAQSLELVKPKIRDTLFWVVADQHDGLVTAETEFSTPYFSLERMTHLLDQAYPLDEEE